MRNFLVLGVFFVFISVDWDGDDPARGAHWPDDDTGCSSSDRSRDDPGCESGERDEDDTECLRSCDNGFDYCLDKVYANETTATAEDCEDDMYECFDGCEDGFGCS